MNTMMKTFNLDEYYNEIDKCKTIRDVNAVYSSFKKEIEDIMFVKFNERIMKIYDEYIKAVENGNDATLV